MRQAIALLLLSVVSALGGRAVPDVFLRLPVLVEMNGNPSGSGFYVEVEKGLFFVTAKHVLFSKKTGFRDLNADKGTFTSYPDASGQDRFTIEVDLARARTNGTLRSHQGHDVVVFHVGHGIAEDGKGTAKRLAVLETVKVLQSAKGNVAALSRSSTRTYTDVLLSNEIYVFGYPSSLSLAGSLDPKYPLIKRGIVSGKDARTQRIILDCAVFQGNSGSIVIEMEQQDALTQNFRAIGVATEMIPFVEIMESKHYGYLNRNVSNSGYSFAEPIDFVFELIDSF